jgi:dUTP pyrophosphatase
MNIPKQLQKLVFWQFQSFRNLTILSGPILTIWGHLRSSNFGALEPSKCQFLKLFGYKNEVPIRIKKGAKPPLYASEESSGADIRAHIQNEIVLPPGESATVPTGLYFAIPKGFEIQVRPRSGLAAKYGITVLNTPGTIDSDYRGELGVILINHGARPFVITSDMRIAQIILAPVYRAEFVEKEELVSTTRGEGGFGHTGTH